MLEQSVGFLGFKRSREKYIDPKYRKQIEDWDKKQNLEKGKKIAGAMAEVEKGNLLKGLAQSLGIAQDIREEIKEGDTSSFPYLLGLAILVDLIDFVPVVGMVVKFVAKPILIYGTLFHGRIKYKWGVKIAFVIFSFTEIIPVVNWLPLETISILILWRAIAKKRREKEVEEEENNQLVDSYEHKINEQTLIQQQLQREMALVENEARSGVKNPPREEQRQEYQAVA